MDTLLDTEKSRRNCFTLRYEHKLQGQRIQYEGRSLLDLQRLGCRATRWRKEQQCKRVYG